MKLTFRTIALGVAMMVFATTACGNPNKPENPKTEQGGPWGCYVTSTGLTVSKFKNFDLAMAGCVEEKRRTGLEYYVQGPDKVVHPVELPSQDLVIVTTTLPQGEVGAVYPATTLEATGGTGPYDWTVASGSLPPGMVLTVDGTVQGTPLTAVGSPFQVRIAATDANEVTVTATFEIEILPIGPRITTTTLPDVNEGATYSAQLTAEDGVQPLTFRRTAGSLPPGLVLTTSGSIAGTVGLIPATTTFTFTVEVEDAAGRTSTAELSIRVLAQADVAITTTTLPIGDANVAYSSQLQSTGGVAPIAWSVTGGSPPAGITLSGTGLLSGLSSTAGVFTFTVQARDSIGQVATASLTLTLRAEAPSITTTTLPNGQVGAPYSAAIAWSGGQAPYQVTTTGTVPPGIAVSGTGTISGTPTTRGSYTFTAIVTDANNKSGQQSLTIVVEAPPLSITTTTLPSGRVDEPYTATLAGTGGETPYTWSMFSGSLPPGLALSPAGEITGSPISNVGSPFLFQVQLASADNQTQVRNLSISVDGLALSALVPGVLPVGKVDSPYSYDLNAQGGTAPYTWSLTAGALPPGLTLSANGTISGSPTSNNLPQYVFTVMVTDADGNTDSMQTSMVVEDSDAVLPDATVRWSPPTARVDGTPLDITELGGYRVFARVQGTTEWTVIQDINNPYQNWAEFFNLTDGLVWEFAATAYDTSGLESALSAIVSKEITP